MPWNSLLERDEFLAEICDRLLQAKQHMKQQHDEHHRDLESGACRLGCLQASST